MSAEVGWQAWVGRKGDVVPGPYPVSIASIGYLAEALEDERLAAQLGSPDLVAPRSFITIASRVPNWQPAGATGPPSFMQAMLVPMDAASGVNLGIDQKYYAPVLPGDRLTSQSTIRSITPKRTRLGKGFIIVELIDHRKTDGTLVATTENTLLRFAPEPQGEAKVVVTKAEPPAEPATALQSASDFPTISVPVTATLLAKAAGAVRDYAPLHHNIELARAAGHATAFLSYSHQIALIVSAIGQWLGGDERMRRLKLLMKKPIYLGKTCVVTGLRMPGESDSVESVEVTLSTEEGLCSTGFVEIQQLGTELWS